MSYCTKTIVLLFLLVNTLTLSAQRTYEVNWKNEIPYISASVGTMGLGAYLRTLPPLFTPDELLTLDPQDVNAFDRIAAGSFSSYHDRVSDIFWFGSHLLPYSLLVGKKSRSEFGDIMAMYGEAATLNLGLTVIAKATFRRPRPYVFGTRAPEELRLSRNAKASFVSGHASMTAVNTFFIAQVFSDMYPDSKWRPVIWGTAATIPALAAYLRVAAGRHYPTDVIAGYALGATIGVLIPRLHRSKAFAKGNLSLNAGWNGAHLVWKIR